MLIYIIVGITVVGGSDHKNVATKIVHKNLAPSMKSLVIIVLTNCSVSFMCVNVLYNSLLQQIGRRM